MTSPHLVLGVGGLLTAGKDVFADHLVEAHGFTKLGMSDVLADCLYALNPLVPLGAGELREGENGWDLFPVEGPDTHIRYSRLVDIVGYVKAKQNPEVRRLLQALGTEVGRNILGENIWVDTAKKRILAADNDVAITGIRFKNEIDLITQIGWASTFGAPNIEGTTVWVECPGVVPPAGASSHASEATLSAGDFEYTLLNDGTIDELKGRADGLLVEILEDLAGGRLELGKDLLKLQAGTSSSATPAEVFDLGRSIVDEDHRARGEAPERWRVKR